MSIHLHHNLDLGKLRRIMQLMQKFDEVVKELATLTGGSPAEKPKVARKINPYSVTDLVMSVLKDGKPRKVADISREIKATSGHDVEPATVRGTCKYQVTRGKLYTNEAKEFGMRVAAAAPSVPEPVVVKQEGVL
mgnify:CR=1 FL=1